MKRIALLCVALGFPATCVAAEKPSAFFPHPERPSYFTHCKRPEDFASFLSGHLRIDAWATLQNICYAKCRSVRSVSHHQTLVVR